MLPLPQLGCDRIGKLIGERPRPQRVAPSHDHRLPRSGEEELRFMINARFCSHEKLPSDIIHSYRAMRDLQNCDGFINAVQILSTNRPILELWDNLVSRTCRGFSVFFSACLLAASPPRRRP